MVRIQAAPQSVHLEKPQKLAKHLETAVLETATVMVIMSCNILLAHHRPELLLLNSPKGSMGSNSLY